MKDTQTTRELVQEVISDIQEIMRSELRLAKTEVKEEGAKAGSAAGMFAAAGILALFGLALFEGMGVVLWAMLTPLWIAFLIMGLISVLTAGILFAAGRERWRKVHPVPKTVTTLKEDLEWARNQTR
jgi:hypothetical protein